MPPTEPAAPVEKSTRAVVVDDLRQVRNAFADLAARLPAIIRAVDSITAYLEETENDGRT